MRGHTASWQPVLIIQLLPLLTLIHPLAPLIIVRINDNCYFYKYPLSLSDPIDLTQDSQDDDLQKALALSLQDMQHQGGVISLEEQELSKYEEREREREGENNN